ncbi:hypothetical protein D3C78_1908400 [compost metagenome]
MILFQLAATLGVLLPDRHLLLHQLALLVGHPDARNLDVTLALVQIEFTLDSAEVACRLSSLLGRFFSLLPGLNLPEQ